MKVEISPPDPNWPTDFQQIKAELEVALAHEGARYLDVVHVGSTAVPNLPAKPIIDIAIVIEHWLAFEKVEEALNFGGPDFALPSYKHTGDGGVKDRPSFKASDRDLLPWRNIYVLLEDSIILRSHRDLVQVLSSNAALRQRYAWTKMRLAAKGEYEDVMEYAQAKNEVIRDILRMAEWSEEQIREKEAMATRNWARADTR